MKQRMVKKNSLENLYIYYILNNNIFDTVT